MKREIFVGIDIEKISRVKKLISLKSPTLLQFFTENELALNERQIAGNFAVKEAIKKALPWIKRLEFAKFEVLRDPDGRPYINILNYRLLKELEIDVSISNLEDIVVGIAIIQK